MADVCPHPARSLPRAIDTSRHHCECVCPHCEHDGTGQFAQRAALAGDPSALAKLPLTLVRELVALRRASRRSHRNAPTTNQGVHAMSEPTSPEIQPAKRPRGFAAMDKTRQRQLASFGGKAAHERGRGRRFTSEEASDAGRKGGRIVSQDRDHMSRIGARGGKVRARRLRDSSHSGTCVLVRDLGLSTND